MKRSEVIEKVRRECQANGFDLGPTADRCIALARALGVEVEEDEPELPDRLWIGGGRLYGHFGTNDPYIHAFGEMGAPPKIQDALVAAYNERGKGGWQKGTPPSGGGYIAYWHRGRFASGGWETIIIGPLVQGEAWPHDSPPDFWIRLPESR